MKAAASSVALRADCTRLRLLATAERLFAERGVRGVGLREISVEAGQRNNSAAQYHFGSRAGLVEAVFTNRMSAVNARRRCFLEALLLESPPWGVRRLVEVQIGALLDVVALDGSSWFACFLAQAFADNEYRHLLDLRHEVNAPMKDLVQYLDHELAFLPARIRQHRIEYSNITITNVLAAYERAGRAHGALHSDRSSVEIELTDAVVGMLMAPAS